MLVDRFPVTVQEGQSLAVGVDVLSRDHGPWQEERDVWRAAARAFLLAPTAISTRETQLEKGAPPPGPSGIEEPPLCP